MNTVSVKDGRQAQAEALILYRDRLRKDCRQIMTKYLQAFGTLTVQVLQARISCIRKKKMIRYIRTSINLGQEANLKELTDILKTELEEYEKKLEELKLECKAGQTYQAADEEALRNADRNYRELARILHPQLHPETKTDPVLLDLWRRAEAAYYANDTEKMQELRMLAAGHLMSLDQRASGSCRLSESGEMHPDPSFPIDLNRQIQLLEMEIRHILSSEPYIYQPLLNDAVQAEKKRVNLREELVSYKLYLTELDAQLAELAKQQVV